MKRLVALAVVIGTAFALGAPAEAATERPRLKTHQVYPGQTLGMIAKRYGITVEALRNANALEQSAPIKPRQRLIIPNRHDKDGSLAREQRLAKGTDFPTQAPGAARIEPAQDRPESTRRDARRGDESLAGRRSGKGKSSLPAEPFARKTRKTGYVVISSNMGSWRGQAVTRHGKLAAGAPKGFASVLASWRTGAKDQIDERLIRVIARVSDHFGGRVIHVVSGYRPWSAQQYTQHSRHNAGQAVDFNVTGVPNSVVRDFCRTLPSVGVGYYPNSSFVHLDVRETPTYWVDYSGPGQPPRYASADGRDPSTQRPAAIAPQNSSSSGGGHAEPAAESVPTESRSQSTHDQVHDIVR